MKGNILRCSVWIIPLIIIYPVTASNQIFQAEILGHLGEQLLGIPVPPNYNDTEAPADVLYYKQLVFRLNYSGTTPCEITRLQITQEVDYYNVVWNYTNVIRDISPTITLLKGKSFDFLVNGTPHFVMSGIFFIKIETVNIGNFYIKASSTGIGQSLSTFEHSSDTTTPEISSGFLMLFSFITCLIASCIRRRRKIVIKRAVL
ncbi:MAG: hypothetical protein ACXAC8_04455 [Candidatus Hodarchaeales archaeon]